MKPASPPTPTSTPSAMMEELTPAIEPLSLDEAFLDLSGTQRLHGAPPAVLRCPPHTERMEDELGLTGSIGLSHNKFLAEIANDLGKPAASPSSARPKASSSSTRPVRIIRAWARRANGPRIRRHPHHP